MTKKKRDETTMLSPCCYATIETVRAPAGMPFPKGSIRERDICTACKRCLRQRVVEQTASSKS
jgi:hypothetical protein